MSVKVQEDEMVNILVSEGKDVFCSYDNTLLDYEKIAYESMQLGYAVRHRDGKMIFEKD